MAGNDNFGINVLLIGSGGREHAIARSISRSPWLGSLYVVGGNPGIRRLARKLAVNITDHDGILRFCRTLGIDLVVVGPEAPLAAGLVNDLDAGGVRVFGPTKEAAILETSKGFVKDMCCSIGIPTADYRRFADVDEAKDYLRDRTFEKIVVKADGLAAGKGVCVANSLEEALNAADRLGPELVVEEYLQGGEFSLFAICGDDGSVRVMQPVKDYKPAWVGGPNTGGMGAVCPAPDISADTVAAAVERIIQPTLKHMRNRGTPFSGLLYAGLMQTKDGVFLIEYNARFGDPETQALLGLLESDLLMALLQAKADRHWCDLADLRYRDGAAVCVALCAEGYPGEDLRLGTVLGAGLGRELDGDCYVLHAGTGYAEDGAVVSVGGRVLNVVAYGDDVVAAREMAYKLVGKLAWPGCLFRSDIGL